MSQTHDSVRSSILHTGWYQLATRSKGNRLIERIGLAPTGSGKPIPRDKWRIAFSWCSIVIATYQVVNCLAEQAAVRPESSRAFIRSAARAAAKPVPVTLNGHKSTLTHAASSRFQLSIFHYVIPFRRLYTKKRQEVNGHHPVSPAYQYYFP